MPDFDSSVSDFTRFALQQGYPSALLWTSPEWALLWRRCFFVFAGDPEKRRLQARASFDAATARNTGVAIEARCKTQTLTICRLCVPDDDIDAQFRMIPEVGVKMSMAAEPPPVVIVRNPVLRWVLKRLSRGGKSWSV